MMPWLVLTMTTPSPPSTRGMSVLAAYTRRPGLLTRLSPLITGTLPTYLSCRRRNARGPSWCSSNDSMKPSSWRMWAIARLVLDAGTRISVWRARLPFRIRVSMSATGSDTFMGLPARLRHAGQLAQQCALTEADSAQPKAAHVAPRPTTDVAAVVGLHRLVRLALLLRDE